MDDHQLTPEANHLESDQASVTPSLDDLSRLLEQKRADAGIVVVDDSVDVFERVAASIKAMRHADPEAPADPQLVRQVEIQAEMRQFEHAAGERYRSCRLTNFTCSSQYQSRVVDAVREYGKSLEARRASREGLVLFGPVGTGKDHLAYALALHAAYGGLTVRWINGQSWFGSVRDAMDTDRTEASIIRELEKPDMVVISDPLPPIGDLTQHQATMLYRAIEARYSHGKLTVTTVNVADDTEADRRMGAATWDRLCHEAWKIHCNWPSFRKPARVVKKDTP